MSLRTERVERLREILAKLPAEKAPDGRLVPFEKKE